MFGFFDGRHWFGVAVLSDGDAGGFVEQRDFDAGIAAAGELIAGGGQRLIASGLAEAQSIVWNPQSLELRHDGEATVVAQLPVAAVGTVGGKRTTGRMTADFDFLRFA